MTAQIFVSSVQSEFAAERRAIKDYVHGDPLLSKHFRVFIFEDVPAQERSPKDVYVDEVDQSAVYVGLFGERYGFEDDAGVSPTEREFDRAVQRRIDRLVFLKLGTDGARQAKMARLIAKAERQLTRQAFADVADLTGQLYASLVRILERDRLIQVLPFDARYANVQLSVIDETLLSAFVAQAVSARNFSLKRRANAKETLDHLNLLDKERPNNAAVILFSRDPKRVIPGAFVNCQHYPGTEPVRPALSQNNLGGPLSDQIDGAVSFIMSRLSQPVGTRDTSARLPVAPELPKAAVAEAIINAVAHRDYTSRAPVQVRLFADRLEVMNPGELPRSLTPEQLKRSHPSIPNNPLISGALYLAGYVEGAGTGTLDMVAKCRDAHLPEPDFFQDGDQWIVRIWRDWLTDEFLQGFQLNDRQRQAITAVKSQGRIDNRTYQTLTGTSERSAARELKVLADMGLLVRTAGTGRGTAYERATAKPAVMPPKAPKAPKSKTRQKPAKPAKRTKGNKPRQSKS